VLDCFSKQRVIPGAHGLRIAHVMCVASRVPHYCGIAWARGAVERGATLFVPPVHGPRSRKAGVPLTLMGDVELNEGRGVVLLG
jgi:hypothetical protein